MHRADPDPPDRVRLPDEPARDPYQGVSPDEQARWLQEAGYRAWRDPRIKTLVQYEWRDDPLQHKGARRERLRRLAVRACCFADSRPKPALDAFANPFWVTAHPGGPASRSGARCAPATPTPSASSAASRVARGARSKTVQTDPFGAFRASSSCLPGAAELRFAYQLAIDPSRAASRTTASPAVTVRRSIGVLPPR